MTVSIRAAQPADNALIFALICELADYENLQGEVDATPEEIAAALFAPQPRLYCDIAEWNGRPAGFAVWFLNFSTFRGRHGMYLEDLYVRPEFRKKGLGIDLIKAVARIGVQRNCGRFEWTALNWNKPALDFYARLGAQTMDEWVLLRLDAEGLRRVAGE